MQVVAFYSHARRCWSVLCSRWARGQTYEHQFSGRMVIRHQDDFAIVRDYLTQNFGTACVLPNIQAWQGILSWVRAHASLFREAIAYVEERGPSGTLAPGGHRGNA